MSTLTKKTLPKKSVARRQVTDKSRRQPDLVFVDSLLSVDDWLAMPDTKPRYELIDGKLIQDMTTTSDHAWAVTQLLAACVVWANESNWRFFAEGMGYKADDRNGFVPDIVGFRPEQEVKSGITQMPTPYLAVEVLSPGTAKRDKTHKRMMYALGGVPMYVMIDTANQTLEVFRLNESNDKYAEPEVFGGRDVWQPAELPGFKLELSKLWMK